MPAGGLLVPTGGLLVPAGGFSVPPGGMLVPPGALEVQVGSSVTGQTVVETGMVSVMVVTVLVGQLGTSVGH